MGAAPPVSRQSSSPPYYLPTDSPSLRGGYLFFITIFSRYNSGMEKDKIMNNCCGRPMHYDKTPKCKYNDCCLNEYNYTMPACIRNKQPDCMAKAVIPSVTVDTTEGLTNLANCFVHVTSINTTFYIDDKHRPMMVWAGDVEVNLPASVVTDAQWEEFLHSFNLKGQFLYVKTHNTENDKDIIISFYFDKTGKIYGAGEFEEVTEA